MRFDFTRAVAAACAFTCLSVSIHAGVNAWTAKGPPGGEPVRDVAASPTDPNVYYVAYGRTFSRSTDGAVTWSEVGGFDGQVVNIAVDPTDGRRVYVAVYEHGLFRSENGGDTFTQIAPSSPSIWSVGVGGTGGQTVYYATATGAFFGSTNRGASFTQRTSTFQTISRIYVEGDGSQVIALRGPYLARSSDGGGTWSETSPSGSSLYQLVRLSPTSLLLGAGDGIHVSTTDGASWQRKAIGGFSGLVRDPQTPTTLYGTALWGDRLWRSVDSGQNWSPTGAAMIGDGRGLAISAVGTGSRLVAASLGGVMHSQTGGVTWTESTSGPVGTTPDQMATTVAPNSRVIAFTGAGGLFSTSQDSAWRRLDLTQVNQFVGNFQYGQAAIALKPGAPNSIYMIPFMGPLVVSNDGGTVWSSPSAALNSYSVTRLAFDPVNTNTLYAALSQGVNTPASYLYRSANGGSTWTPLGDLPRVYPLDFVVDPANPARMFLASYQGFNAPNTGGLYRSVNGGVNWTERGFPGIDVRRIAIDPSDTNRVYAATQQGLQVSTNGGTSFARNDPFYNDVSPLSVGAVAVDPTVPNTLYAASQDPGYGFGVQQGSSVARSVDRGATWEVLRAGSATPTWYVGELVLDPNLPSLLYVNTGGHGVATYEIQNDLAVTLSGHSGARPVGTASNYTARVTHNGALAATAVRLDLTMPGGLAAVSATPTLGSCSLSGGSPGCDIPVLRPGQSVDVVVSYTPPSAIALPVTAQVSAHERDGTTSNNSAQASAIAGEVVDLRLAVTPSATAVDHGDAFSYAVQVTNDGPVTASVAAVALIAGNGLTLGAAPAGCTIAGSQVTCVYNGLAPGASRSVTVNATAASIGALTAQVAVSAAPSAADTNPANNSAAPAVTSRAVADLSVTASDSADPVQRGAAFNYVVEVRNLGPDDMPAVTAALTGAGAPGAVTTSLGTCTTSGSAVSCALGVLAAGATATITIPTNVATAGTNTLHATVAGGGTDRVATNNSVDQATVVNAPASGSSSGGGGSGGGSLDALLLLALAALLGWRAVGPKSGAGQRFYGVTSRRRLDERR